MSGSYLHCGGKTVKATRGTKKGPERARAFSVGYSAQQSAGFVGAQRGGPLAGGGEGNDLTGFT